MHQNIGLIKLLEFKDKDRLFSLLTRNNNSSVQEEESGWPQISPQHNLMPEDDEMIFKSSEGYKHEYI